MNLNVIAAIFRRNFVSYFSNPTGYVFICVFVLLGSFAAFWPDEFFNANLANLDQLNRWFPYIMLVFIPAITMSIWADERRQGTDELLLTIPATDFDVVLGKYFAAVAIYTVALLFSLFCNLALLGRLGSPAWPFAGWPDVGLFLGTYFGYWMVGLAMLSIGMVASFLTGNLTVAFILGVAFNAPLVFLNVIDGIVRGSSWTATAKGWSVGEQMSDFGRGVLSFASIAYFLMTVVVMLYLCMVLIGRRHWLGGHNGKSLGPHYLARALALVGIAVGVNLLVQNLNLRADVTQEGLNSVAAESRKLVAELDPKHPVVIEAYISPNIPEEFIQTKVDLLNLLREFQQISHGKIQTKVYENVEPLTEEAQRAEQQFGITPQDIFTQTRGVWKQEQVLLGAAITSGLEKITIPFFERGIPVEYELLRSIATISQPKRKRIGVVQTDAELFGGFGMTQSGPQQRPRERLIEELEKQYEVVRVDPNSPITETFDVMLAVQPSSLTQPQLNNFVEAVRKGQPTAIFEDPLSGYINGSGGPVAGTGQPKRPKQDAMSMFQPPRQPEQKGNIKQLWDLLGVEMAERSRADMFGSVDKDVAVVWQQFKPQKFEGLDQLTPEYIFISKDAPGANDPFNQKDVISSQLQEVIMPLPGAFNAKKGASTDFMPLITTGDMTGTIMVKDLIAAHGAPLAIRTAEGAPTKLLYVLAAHITGMPKTLDEDDEDPAAKDAKKDDKADAKKDAKSESKKGDAKDVAAALAGKKPGVNVVLVADIDMLASLFFDSRARRMPDGELQIDADNVTFVLNTLDVLAGDNRFVALRKRRPVHRPLTTVIDSTQHARDDAEAARASYEKDRDDQERQLNESFAAAEKALKDQLTALQKDPDADPRAAQQKMIELSLKLQVDQHRKEAREEQLRREAQRKVEQANRDLVSAVRGVQDRYKLWSVLLPPIPPLLVAFFVYFHRRNKEREGVSKARLR
jgi:ABC-2 type transport system permease protein